MGAANPSTNKKPRKTRTCGQADQTLIRGRSRRQTAAQTHVAVVDVEDVDSGSRLHFLHSGPVPAGERHGWRWREQTEGKHTSQ